MGRTTFKPILVKRTHCRICGSASLTPIVSLGEQFLGGVLASEDGTAFIKRRVPLEVVRCDPGRDQEACGLVQMRHTVPPTVLYQKYYYQSGINQSMRDNLATIARMAAEIAGLAPGHLVLDIGCNDGTLLLSYEVEGLRRLGIDPSDVGLQAREKGLEVLNTFFTAEAFRDAYPDDKPIVITSIAMFYDLEDPNAFVADIKKVLHERGVWILEQSYLPAMLRMNSFDTICHEHLEYYSLATLENLFSAHELEVIDIKLNDVNGGSSRLAVGHTGKHKISSEAIARLQEIRLREFELALDTDAPYAIFRDNIESIRADLRRFLEKARTERKITHGYGASTKGNTTLQYCSITSELVSAIADRNPRKWGQYTIGSKVRIISEEESRAQKPDYYLVLPWHFMAEFKQREAEFLARGGKFLVPMPQVHLVGADDPV
jgi:hypothetical protein